MLILAVHSVDRRIKKVYTPAIEPIEITHDSMRIEHGEHLASLMCSGCHGYQFTGRPLLQDTSRLILYSSNLRAKPSNKSKRENQDWYLALRHGLHSDGTSLFLMPAANIAHLTDHDLGDLVSYFESLAPVGEQVPSANLSSWGKLDLLLFDNYEWLSAEQFASTNNAKSDSSNMEPGEYYVEILYCKTCHGAHWEGKYFKAPVDRHVPALSDCRVPNEWPEEDFVRFMRTGIGDSERHIRPPFNRNKGYRFLTYEEANDIYQYFKKSCTP